MIKYELFRYIHKNYIRIIGVIFVLILIGLYSLKNVQLLLELSGLINSMNKINIHDYIIGTFNSFQLVMSFGFPVLFSILVSDLIMSDYKNGYIDMIFTRVDSIFNYVIKKCIFTFFIAVGFTLSFIVIVLGISLFSNLRIDESSSHYIFKLYSENSYIYIYMKTILKFLTGLTFIGLLTILISVCTKNSAISVGIIVIMAFIHNVLYVLGSELISLLPFTQYIVGLHHEFYPFGVSLSYFTQSFSDIYMIVGSIFIAIIILIKLKKLQGVVK